MRKDDRMMAAPAHELPVAPYRAWCQRCGVDVKWNPRTEHVVGHGLPPAPTNALHIDDPDFDPAGPKSRPCPGPYVALRVDRAQSPLGLCDECDLIGSQGCDCLTDQPIPGSGGQP